HVRRLERAGRDDDLLGGDRPSVNLQPEGPVAALLEPRHLAVELDGQIERIPVALEVGDHLVSGRVAVRIAGKGKPRQRAVTARCEERERLPTLAPRRSDLAGTLENDETAAMATQIVAHRKPCLARADDGDLDVVD